MTVSCPVKKSIEIPRNTLHVWTVKLNRVNRRTLQKTLSADEGRCAAACKNQEIQSGILVRRGVLKTILAPYLGCLPCKILLSLGKYGKPYLEIKPGSPTVSFNMSSAGDIALVVLSAKGNVGVDVETVFPIEEYQELLSVFATDQEAQYLATRSSEEKPQAFFRIWTVKEAILKAAGCGFLGSPKNINVPMPCDHFDISSDPLGTFHKGQRIYCRTLDLGGHYRGALASDQKPVHITSFGMDNFLTLEGGDNFDANSLIRDRSFERSTFHSRQ